MGQIIPFITRVTASGDWSAEERARLHELGDRFLAAGIRVEVIYGATEEGDPWCVVKDEAEEVLIHVARIGGRFVVHCAFDDALTEGADLPEMLGERLAWEETPGVVMPFSRQAQSLLALIVATAFFYDAARHEGSEAPDTEHAAGFGPTEQLAAHASAGDLEPASLAGAAHAESSTPAAILAPVDAGRLAEWRSFAFADDDLGRADHGGAGAAIQRFAVAAIPPLATLDVVLAHAPETSSSVVAAYEPLRLGAPERLAAAGSSPSGGSQGTGSGGDAGVSLVSSFRPTAPEHPPVERQPANPQPVVTSGRWVDPDLDGDGRLDPRAPANDHRPAPEPSEPAHHLADGGHGDIVAVGQAFAHHDIV